MANIKKTGLNSKLRIQSKITDLRSERARITWIIRKLKIQLAQQST